MENELNRGVEIRRRRANRTIVCIVLSLIPPLNVMYARDITLVMNKDLINPQITQIFTDFLFPYKSSYLLPHRIISLPNPEGISYQVYLNIFLQYFQYPQGLEVLLALSLIISNLLVLDNMP